MAPTKKDNVAVRVRPETRQKVERIAKANRWSLVETIDVLADAFVQAGKSGQPFAAALPTPASAG